MEIILLQMGKVASTAIAQGLRAAGCDVLQAHIGAPARLTKKFQLLMSEQVTDAVANRMYADYLQELRVTFLLARKGLARSPSLPIKVITLVRDPVDWYWSHFAQNYDHYQEQLLRFHRSRGGDPEHLDWEQVFETMQQLMFRVLEHHPGPLDDGRALAALVSAANALDASGVVAAQVYNFLVPLRWFDEDFLPATGIDLYECAFEPDRGYAHLAAEGLDVLLLSYEQLGELPDVIAEFAGVDAFELPVANTAEQKALPFDIRRQRRRGVKILSDDLRKKLYATRYARHFGYPRLLESQKSPWYVRAASRFRQLFGSEY
jgi:hypothetical protein